MRNTAWFLGLAMVATSVLGTRAAVAEQKNRWQRNSVRGDFVWIGNTLAQECDARATAPLVGTLDRNACGSFLPDTGADVFWTAMPDDPSASFEPHAGPDVSAARASSTALLGLPPGARVLYARLYWGAESLTNTETDRQEMQSVTLERLTDPYVYDAQCSWTIRAEGTAELPGLHIAAKANQDGDIYWYEGSADVTDLIAGNEPTCPDSDFPSVRAYRVSGVKSVALDNFQSHDTFAAWSLVVFYALESQSYRNLALFDGLDFVREGNAVAATITGFKVPYAGYDAKLGVMAFEGDTYWTGDSLIFNGVRLGDDPSVDGGPGTINPRDDFFNGTRSWLGQPVSVVGDLPQMDGRPNSMSGFDLDVMDISSAVAVGDTEATFQATSSGDTYVLGAFATSIGTFQPDFNQSVKSYINLDGKAVVAGNEIEYTIVVKNTGNDDAVNVRLVDELPDEVTYVAGSLRVSPDGATADAGETAMSLTDEVDADQGEYIPPSVTDGGNVKAQIVVRLGEGATGTAGGAIPIGGSTTVKLRAKVKSGATGQIVNQAKIFADGVDGYDGSQNPGQTQAPTAGGGPTIFPIAECDSDLDCSAPEPVCNPATNLCVGCLVDSDCGSTNSGRVCDQSINTCINGCRGTGGNTCPSGQICSSATTVIGRCSTPSTGAGGAGGDAGIGGADGAADAGRDASMGGGGAGGAGGTGGRRDGGLYDGGGGAGGGPGIDARGLDGRFAYDGGMAGADGAVVYDGARSVDVLDVPAARDLPAGDAAGRDVIAQADAPVVIPAFDARSAEPPVEVSVPGLGWSVQGGGCSCSTGARPSSGPAAVFWGGLAIGLGVVLRRKRRR